MTSKLTLKITAGPAAGHQIVLLPGRKIKVGRSPQADFVVPGDVELSGLHFSVECANGTCAVRDLGSTNGLFLNEQRVAECVLGDGDELRAGKSVFAIARYEPAAHTHVAHTEQPAAAERPTAAAVETDTDGFIKRPASELAQLCEFQDGAERHLKEGQTSRQFLDVLVRHELFADALRYLAHALPKTKAIQWACHCIRAAAEECELIATSTAALAAAETWLAEPTEENRRAAMTAAQADEFSSAAAWAAMGAFWSGGSMAPPEAPLVPPRADLTAKAVSGAVQLAAVCSQPERAPEKHRRFFELGLRLARGEVLTG